MGKIGVRMQGLRLAFYRVEKGGEAGKAVGRWNPVAGHEWPGGGAVSGEEEGKAVRGYAGALKPCSVEETEGARGREGRRGVAVW
jgi:hypothetical protein